MLAKTTSQGWVRQLSPVLSDLIVVMGLAQSMLPDSSTKPSGLQPSCLFGMFLTLHDFFLLAGKVSYW